MVEAQLSVIAAATELQDRSAVLAKDGHAGRAPLGVGYPVNNLGLVGKVERVLDIDLVAACEGLLAHARVVCFAGCHGLATGNCEQGRSGMMN
jgi:hypothetical protein